MKRYRFFLLMLCLICGVGFPLSAQGNTDRFVMEERQDMIESQNNEEPENKVELQKEEEPQSKTKIKLTGNQLIIEDLVKDSVLDIYNIMGVKVYNRRVKAGTNQYILSLPKGYYIIKIDKLTRKIAIK